MSKLYVKKINGYYVKDEESLHGEDIVDNLNSDDSEKVLSAKQGKNLNTQINTSNYYDEITYEQKRYNNTDCYIVTIPKYDNNDNLIPLYVDKDTTKSPNEYAVANKTTLTINGGLTKQNAQEEWIQGIVIGNGNVLSGEPQGVTIQDYNLYIGFNENRELLEFVANETTPEEMLDAGVKNGYMVFYRYLNNGELEEHLDAPNWNVKSPRMDIGIKENGDLVLLVCDGRTNNNEGLDDEQALAILLEYDCVKGFRTDGGGSTSLNIKEVKINRNIDNSGTTDRQIDITLNVNKEIVNNEMSKVYDEISTQKQELNKQIREDLNQRIKDYANNIENTRNSLYLVVEDASLNNIVTANTYQELKFSTGKYAHNDGIGVVRDENNKIIGYELKKSGLYRVVVVANFESNGAGAKSIKITKGNNDELDRFQSISTAETSTIWKQMTCETVINNPTQSILPIKVWIKSENLDRFVRCSVFIESLGGAV